MKDSTLLLAAFLILLIGFFSVDNTLSGQAFGDTRRVYLREAPQITNLELARAAGAQLLGNAYSACDGNKDGFVSHRELENARGEVANARGAADYALRADRVRELERCIVENTPKKTAGACGSSQEGRFLAFQGNVYTCRGGVLELEDDCETNEQPDIRLGRCAKGPGFYQTESGWKAYG